MVATQDSLTEVVIGHAIDVHRELGPGLLETPYRLALSIALKQGGLVVERERCYPIVYRGVHLGDYRPDIIVQGEVIVEVKSVARYDPVFLAQILTYLRVTGLRRGLIVNFNRPRLVDGIKRVSL
jgi:GxxExxY protein